MIYLSMSPSPKRARLENHPLPLDDDDKQRHLLHIPEDIIFSKILPFLSFANLSKLKRICKSWCGFISSNLMTLPLDRCRRGVPSYSGVVLSRCDLKDQLVFLPTCGDPLDVPDIRNVSFTRQYSGMEIVASTNGLLCLRYGNYGFYLRSPSAKEHLVPLRNSWYNSPDPHVWLSVVGLAYDPSESPTRYKLVCPRSRYARGRYPLEFEVFSSETNRWVKPCYNGYVECNYSRIKNSVYAGGVLYWNCVTCLLYFDPEKDVGGIVPLPSEPSQTMRDHHEIGEFGGHLTFSRVSKKGMELWIMDGGWRGYWELMYCVSLETMFKKCGSSWSRNELRSMFQQFDILALPYDGSERFFMRVCVGGGKQEKVLCYNMKSGELAKFCTVLWPDMDRQFNSDGNSFLYRREYMGPVSRG